MYMYIFASLLLFITLASFIFGFLVIMLTYFVYVIGLSLMIWMIVDAAKSDKYWWVAIMVALPLIGSLIYFFVEKEHDYEKIPRLKSNK